MLLPGCYGPWRVGPWPLWLKFHHTWVKGGEGRTLYPEVSPSSDAQGPVPTSCWVLPKPRGADLPESNTMPCWGKGPRHKDPKMHHRTKITIMSSLICQIYKLDLWSMFCLGAAQ